MWKFSIRLLRSNPALNLWKPIVLMFATLVLPLASVFSLCVTCFLMNIHKESAKLRAVAPTRLTHH